jgi:hypothetical protein
MIKKQSFNYRLKYFLILDLFIIEKIYKEFYRECFQLYGQHLVYYQQDTWLAHFFLDFIAFNQYNG